MDKNFFANKYLIFLLSFFSPMIIDIGGEVSPSFLFILGTFPFWYKHLDTKNEHYKYIIHLFWFLIGVQVVWAFFAETELIVQIKGLLIVISGMLYFMYYFMVYKCNREVIKWGALATFLASFVFINVLVEREGSDFGMWKFQVFPRLVTLCTVIYLWFGENDKIKSFIPYLFVLVGILGIITGARSSGLIPFIAGCCCLLLAGRINLSKVKKSLFIGSLIFYLFYTLLYVPNVLNGNITSGNSEQLKRSENPYNPINLLMVGRGDAIVPFMAFFDKPLIGWGYGTSDPGFKYNRLKFELSNMDEIVSSEEHILASPIPGHSGWGYLSCSYGLLGFLIIFFMLKKTFGLVFNSLLIPDKYLLLRILTSVSFLWNLLFSPLAHFKTSPESIALIIVLSTMAMEKGCIGYRRIES